MNAAARLIFSSSRFDHINPLLRQLHWLEASERIARPRIQMPLRSAPSYLVDELRQVADVEARQRLRSASSSSLIASGQPHTTIHRRGPSLSACHCSNLERFTSARHFCNFVACLPVTPQDSSLHHFLSQSVTMCSAFAVTLVISDTLIVHVTYLLTYLLYA